MLLKQWPCEDRPREKLIKFGSESLSDVELLAILLHKGIHGNSVMQLACQLLNQHGNLSKILTSSYEQLSHHRGLGMAKYCQLQAALELHHRILAERLKPKTVISQLADVTNFLTARLRDHEQEIFACLFLDNQHRVIRFEKLFYGSIKCANVYPREVVRKSLLYNAGAIIVAHNHPSGNAKPSSADKAVTHTLREALELVEVRLLDHIIVGDTTTSLANHGWL